jgi:hypothetical protein
MALSDDPRLAVALGHLADDPLAQERYLREIGTWPSLDELALELDDAPPRAAETPVPLTLLSDRLDEMSGRANARLWEPEALHGPEWEEVRRLAAEALSALGGHC